MNNFKELEQMELAQARFKNEYVKASITNSVGKVRFVGDMLDLYIPKVLGVFIGMSGGQVKQNDTRSPKYPNTPF